MKRYVLSAALLAILGGAPMSGCSAPGGLVGPPTPAPASTGTACIVAQPRPEPVSPWKDVDELCRAPHGKPWPGPSWDGGEEKAALEIRRFLQSEAYKKEPYNWVHDANWRLTGPYEGCPCPDKPGGECAYVDKTTHYAARIYYSPEAIDWMCKYRRGESELTGSEEMPDNALIIKEMVHEPSSMHFALVPGTNKLWLALPPGKPEGHYDQVFDLWSIMLKKRSLSTDGWFWGIYPKKGSMNPPIYDRGAFTRTPFPGMGGAKVEEPPGCDWLPTYWQRSVANQVYPNVEAGHFCVSCHASVQGEMTFSSFSNILGKEILFPWTPPPSSPPPSSPPPSSPPPPPGPQAEDGAQKAKERDAAAASSCPNSPFPSPRRELLPGFSRAFPELDPKFSEVWETRLPAHTYDHAVSTLGVASVAPSSSQFLTSDQCESCHDAGGDTQLDQPYMVERVIGAGGRKEQINLSAWSEWSVSPMGLAGRDPVFHSQLELERNIAGAQRGLAGVKDCIDNTCLHCHGAAGARQYNIDTAGKGPAGDACKDFLPPKSERRAAGYDGAPFTGRMVSAWRDESPELAKYGALAREGVTCTVCHHISDKDLDQKNLPKTFTGNFRIGPPDKLFGSIPSEKIKPKPMQRALGITPEVGAQLLSSELCGSCHTVRLPVFDDAGKLAGSAYEQTTYLEWLLSDSSGYGGKEARSCQSCHMPHEYRGKSIHTGIANIQDSRFPDAHFLLPKGDIDIEVRQYSRHKLYGLNVFLNAYAQQYPLLLGIRQQNYMNGYVEASLVTGLESVLEVAAKETAKVDVSLPVWKNDALEATVTVQNLSGHSLPSGVGFRRLFLQVEVLGAGDEVLWASGRTNDVGLILRGTTEEPLPTEAFQPGPDGLPFQPHREVVSSEDQVQIYEDLMQTSEMQFSTSFLHRYWTIKDNRIRPKGYSPDKVPDASLRNEYEAATRPGTGPERNWWPRPRAEKYRNRQYPAIESYADTKGDPDYQLSAHDRKGLPGADTVTYHMTLPASARSAARRVRVRLYSQSTPPYFFKERFAQAAKKGAERTAAARMYYMAGHLNTAATSPDGTAYLAGYRLQVGAAVEVRVPGR